MEAEAEAERKAVEAERGRQRGREKRGFLLDFGGAETNRVHAEGSDRNILDRMNRIFQD